MLTGYLPSAYEDVSEAVPAVKPYTGIATILKNQLGYRTAFFQSAKGEFECCPGLAYNLGFEKFWAREDLKDPNAYLSYLAADEFQMLKYVLQWIQKDKSPFFVTMMCSVTHDTYEIPKWFGTPAKEHVERYRQTIAYTDQFIAAVDKELKKLNLSDRTILCVISDHGEAFGEHGLSAHERIPFDEALRVPWIIRAPGLIKPQTRIVKPVCSIDLTPTLLTLLGFDTQNAGFDGVNALGNIPDDRRLYFSCWIQQGPTGFVQGMRKIFHDPATDMVSIYNLDTDPLELKGMKADKQQAKEIADQINEWKKYSVFKINQQPKGEKTLFDRWLCHWNDRVANAEYIPKSKQRK